MKIYFYVNGSSKSQEDCDQRASCLQTCSYLLLFGAWRFNLSSQQSSILASFSWIMQGSEENILTLSPPNLESLPNTAGPSRSDIIGTNVQKKKFLDCITLLEAFTDSIWSTAQKWNWIISGIDLTLHLSITTTIKGWKIFINYKMRY